MNTFGRHFRVTLYGESHGKEVGVVVDGIPAGLPLCAQDFSGDLQRRRPGSRGATPRREPDTPCFKSGVFNHSTTGAPVTITFPNKKVRSQDYEGFKDHPRPGHADWTASQKYGGFHDPRGGGPFSGRLSVGLVAAGVIAKKMIAPARVKAQLKEVGGSADISQILEKVQKDKDSVGGLVECWVQGLPSGLGEPYFDSVESLISALVFSIPGVKGIEFGAGFGCSRMRGSECNDVLLNREGKTKTNHSGGINGGITNGNELVFRAAVKPTSSIPRPQKTINMRTGKREALEVQGRHDACIAVRVPVILEAAAAVSLADLMLRAQKIPRIWRKPNET